MSARDHDPASSDGTARAEGSSRRLPWTPVAAGVVAVVLGLAMLGAGQQGDRDRRLGGAGAAGAAPSLSTPITPPAASTRDPLPLSGAGGAWLPSSAEPDYVAVQTLLDRRAAAVLAADRQAFRETAGPDRSVQVVAAAQADAIAQLPVEHWSFTLRGGRGGAVDREATARARSESGSDVYVLRVTLRYRLGGFDRSLVASAHRVTVRHEGGATWSILSDEVSNGAKELWDAGPLTVVNGDRSAVVGVGVDSPDEATLASYAALADRVVRDVSRVWDEPWQERVLVVAPSSTRVMARLLGRDVANYRRVAAVTTGPSNGPDDVSRGDRIYLNPRTFYGLGGLSQEILMRHETIHVATRAATKDELPTWMEEGFADYVGYDGTGVSASAIMRDVRAWVASGGRPRQLPPDEEYAGRNPDLVRTYELSWFAVALLGERYGRSRVVSLYQRMQIETTVDPEGGVDTALRDELGISLQEFTALWRARVLALAS